MQPVRHLACALLLTLALPAWAGSGSDDTYQVSTTAAVLGVGSKGQASVTIAAQRAGIQPRGSPHPQTGGHARPHRRQAQAGAFRSRPVDRQPSPLRGRHHGQRARTQGNRGRDQLRALRRERVPAYQREDNSARRRQARPLSSASQGLFWKGPWEGLSSPRGRAHRAKPACAHAKPAPRSLPL